MAKIVPFRALRYNPAKIWNPERVWRPYGVGRGRS
jgi:hypothetical protein